MRTLAGTDPLKAVRVLKRRVQIAIYVAITGVLALDYLVLGYTPLQLGIAAVISFSIVVIFIEGAFAQAFKLRKRSAYPAIVLAELGRVRYIDAAARDALVVLHRLLALRSSFIALGGEGDLSLVSFSGMRRDSAERLIQAGVSGVHEAMREEPPVAFNPPGLVPAETVPGSDERIVFVPVIALQQPIGVLALVGHKGNGDLKDDELLGGIGGALGLSLENLSQHEELRESENRYHTLVETSTHGIEEIDTSGVITFANAAHHRQYEYAEGELIGMSILDIVATDSERDELRDYLKYIVAEQPPPTPYVGQKRTKSGRIIDVEVAWAYKRDAQGQVTGLISVITDISERKRAEETIKHLAYHDALTGLPNRTLFEDRLAVSLAQARRKKQMVAVMFLDLDRFKVVNDTVGHASGDRLLNGVAERLMGLVRDADSVARVGGDEFTLLLPDVVRPEDTVEVAERVLEALRQPWMLNGHEFRVTTSIGIAMYPSDGEDAESLLRNADTAMYRAKDGGKDNYKLYTPTMNATTAERLALENSLLHSLERGEFLVHYQPQVDISSGRIVGMEALVRWQHPERGLVFPAEFIPVAEETGLIVPLGAWVLRTACAQNKAWQEAGFPPMRVAVNLSARQFQLRDLVDTVAQVLEETRLDPRYLQLEITEGAAMKDVEFTVTMLRELRQMGVQIAMDDFGTGHSSLSYLKRFPINVLKIDQSFVRYIIVDPDDASIASTVIVMAHNLKLKVIAEGVETEDQLAFLRERQCDEMQGYLFSKPAPAEAFEAMLRQGGDRPRAKVPADSP